MKPVLAVIAATAIALGGSTLPAAARLVDGSVTSLSVVPVSGKAEVVIGVAGDVEVRDFTLRTPDRIVLDLRGASLGIARPYDRVSRAGITDVKYSQFDKRTVRVVLYLDAMRSYQVTRNDNEVRISVTVPVAAQFASWSTGRTPSEAKPQTDDVRPAGEPTTTRAVADQVVREPRPEPQEPVVTQASARNVTRPIADRAMVIQQRPQLAPITVTYQDSDIRDVLAAFAAYSGRTIIPSSTIGNLKVNAEIKNQQWDVALRAILSSLGLAATEDANGIIIVDTQQNMASRAVTEPLSTRVLRLNYQRATPVADQIRQRLLLCIPVEASANNAQVAGQPPVPGQPPSAQPAMGVQPTSGGVQPTNRSTATNNLNNVSMTGTCTGRGSVSADETTNSVSITAPISSLDDLVAFANSLDLRQPVVSIKAKIVLVNRTDLDALGIKYDLGGPQQFFNTVIQRTDSLGNSLQPTSPPTVLLGGNTVSAIANASGNVPGAALRLIYSTAIGGFDFSSFLDALQEVNLLDVQAEPSVTTLNNKTANLTSGVQVPFVPLVSSGGTGTTLTGPVTVERVQTGVTLEVTPSVTNNRQIIMHVAVTNADVNFTNNGTLIDNNNVQNDMLVADGQTVVIGGLTQTSVRVTKSGIPLLVDLPFIGRLFGYTTRQEQRRDLLILLTPHIIDAGEQPGDGVRR
jgi:type IV pilus assembly protein PilQ